MQPDSHKLVVIVYLENEWKSFQRSNALFLNTQIEKYNFTVKDNAYN